MSLTRSRFLGTVVTVTAACLVLPATPVAGQQTFTIDDDVTVEMTDGTKLAATLYRPQTAGKHPAVLVRTPYSRSQLGGYVAEPLAEHGFAVIMQDVRGMGGSEGRFIPFVHEKADGLDTLDWMADQPWCNGRIGMWGPSYVGFCGLVLAPEDHPNLKAIVNVSGWGDTQEMVSPGGAMHFMHGLPWTLSDQIRGQGSIRHIDWPKAFRHVPVNEIPTSLGLRSEQWNGAVRLFTGDTLARVAGISGRYATISAPMLHITGWYDFIGRHTLDVYEGVDAATATPQKLIVGPWHHDQQWGDDTVVGDEDFGPASIMGMSKVVTLSQEWFDRWLRDTGTESTGEKPVRLFVMGSNDWREFDQWPPGNVEFQKWYFASSEGANSSDGDGRLSTAPPTAAGRDTFIFDPLDPVPTGGGAHSHFFRDTLGVRNQAAIEERDDVLVYTTPPLEKDLMIVGPLQAVVHASTEGRHTDFTAKLCDVRPDGYVAIIDEGIRRGPDPIDGEPADLMEPGRVYRFTIDCGATAIRIAAGHRLRVEISSSNFPKHTRNPNTGENPEAASRFIEVEQTIMQTPAQPSYIILPVLGG